MINVSTHLMFQGHARAAIDTYATVFPDFAVETIEIYGEGEQFPSGTVRQARISFCGHALVVIDSPR